MPNEQPRLALMVFGTRGDHQPYVPVCRELSERGIKVQAWVLGEKNVAFMKSFGIETVPAPDIPDLEEMLKSNPDLREIMADGSVFTFLKAVGKFMTEHNYTMIMHEWFMKQAAQFRPHSVAYHPLLISTAYAIYEKYKIPVCQACLFPRAPTREWAPLYLTSTGVNLPFGWNLSLHRFILNATNKQTPETIKIRSDDGLPPLTVDDLWDLFFDPRMPTVCGWSSLVAPPPADWPASINLCGYWTLSSDEQVKAFKPSAELERFLKAGSAPAYLGWGSMLPASPEKTARFAVEVAKGAGVRAVVLGGWANISSDSLPAGELQTYAKENMFFSSEALPHEWLFPQCSCCVHHGGAGTTGAVLRSGVPSIITPVMTDQFYWATRINSLKVGEGFSTQLNKINPAALSAAIKECTSNEEIKKNAKDLGEKLRKEKPGHLLAADVLEENCKDSADGTWATLVAPSKTSLSLFACCTSPAFS